MAFVACGVALSVMAFPALARSCNFYNSWADISIILDAESGFTRSGRIFMNDSCNPPPLPQHGIRRAVELMDATKA